jgi:hypothetical protein
MLTKLAALSLTCALGACGGGGGASDPSDSGSGGSGPSVAQCFTAPQTISFKMFEQDQEPAPPEWMIDRVTTGPDTFNGQEVTAQTTLYANGNTDVSYWKITDNGIAVVGNKTFNTISTFDPPWIMAALNMQPNDFIDIPEVVFSEDMTRHSSRNTFVGFETLTLAGKTFTNVCHFRTVFDYGGVSESWVVNGYGPIKKVAPGYLLEYSGEL